MKISNLKGYPQALVDAVLADPYSKGDSDFSITELLKPPRQAALQKIYKDEIEEDVEDRLWALYGQIAHLILERANRKDLAEKRLSMTFDDYKISGQIDTLCLENGALSDYKFTTSYGFMANQPPKPEWIAQLNMQALLIFTNYNIVPTHLEIIGLLRDHQKSKAKEDSNYPQTPIARHDIPLWSWTHTSNFIRQRIDLHVKAMTKLPRCSAEERWTKGDTWAVIRKGQKKAVKVFNNPNEAKDYADANQLHLVHRPEDVVGRRCLDYCSVSQFCTQYQQAQFAVQLKKENRYVSK